MSCGVVRPLDKETFVQQYVLARASHMTNYDPLSSMHRGAEVWEAAHKYSVNSGIPVSKLASNEKPNP
jgi:hypothetical protein